MLLEPVIGYTRVVFATKYLLLFIATILIIALIAMPLFNNVHDNFRLSFSSVEPGTNGEEPKMTNPSFQGVDKDGQTYTITGTTAVKKPDDTLILNDINADINLKDGTSASLTSKTGSYNKKQDALHLSGAVYAKTSQNYEIETESVTASLNNKSATGNNEIKGKSKFATFRADNFQILENGNRLVFKGNVKIVFDQAAYEKDKSESKI
ncbi:MAG: hypothetical protein K0R98_556 [Rickettsiaceae bacterium]|jgi:lipopolysaccharide export system protein LptC|nr:hypothetical protein [Rickettsiaceae bacterium]